LRQRLGYSFQESLSSSTLCRCGPVALAIFRGGGGCWSLDRRIGREF
jgi:hypothetical protein